mmetsp:Transcript_3984/g.7680  ORF Transcript_3984/g.7680 Transcript_3984/m.7680 type:complete len:306 (-) Transcript_3984:1616-2533(-)
MSRLSILLSSEAVPIIRRTACRMKRTRTGHPGQGGAICWLASRGKGICVDDGWILRPVCLQALGQAKLGRSSSHALCVDAGEINSVDGSRRECRDRIRGTTRGKVNVRFQDILGIRFPPHLVDNRDIGKQPLHIAIAEVLALQLLRWEKHIPEVPEVLGWNLPGSSPPEDLDDPPLEALWDRLRPFVTLEIISSLGTPLAKVLKSTMVVDVDFHLVPRAAKVEARHVHQEVMKLLITSFLVLKGVAIVAKLEEVVDLRHEQLLVLQQVRLEARDKQSLDVAFELFHINYFWHGVFGFRGRLSPCW